MPLSPNPAPVAPRVRSPFTGDVVRLADEIEQLVSEGKQLSIRIQGEGETTALEHLASLMNDGWLSSDLLQLEDDTISPSTRECLITIRTSEFVPVDCELRLVGWDRDDFIEYLLARHKQNCGSVMQRLANADPHFADGSPEIWRVILDRMVADESKSDIETIVLDEIYNRFRVPANADSAADYFLLSNADKKHSDGGLQFQHPSIARFLSHQDVRELFVTHRFIQRLSEDKGHDATDLLAGTYEHGLLQSVARQLSDRADIVENLKGWFGGGISGTAANCATLLVRCCPEWRPRGRKLNLRSGNFAGAKWPDLSLEKADLRGAVFEGADLSGATLSNARIGGADFSNADLSQTSCLNIGSPIRKIRLPLRRKRRKGKTTKSKPQNGAEPTRASFIGANLRQANFSGGDFRATSFFDATLYAAKLDVTSFHSCDFENAELSEASFEHCDFKQTRFDRAKMDGCSFRHADFAEIDFAGLSAEQVDFRNTRFVDCEWTGSSLLRCRFTNASLKNARMADILWEFCDLRSADLRGCSFHLGSTRSGLVGSPYPSHGTRTGFYTDEYDEQYFKSPESIRKACLFGADLRGANITGVDFYLVDLREAKVDSTQRDQLISTGAILDDDF